MGRWLVGLLPLGPANDFHQGGVKWCASSACMRYLWYRGVWAFTTGTSFTQLSSPCSLSSQFERHAVGLGSTWASAAGCRPSEQGKRHVWGQVSQSHPTMGVRFEGGREPKIFLRRSPSLTAPRWAAAAMRVCAVCDCVYVTANLQASSSPTHHSRKGAKGANNSTGRIRKPILQRPAGHHCATLAETIDSISAHLRERWCNS